jgi:hypothetical protein
LAQSGDVQIQPTSKPIMQADSNPRQVQQQVKTGSVKQANEEQLEVVIKKELSNENIEHLESDQEKMVLELFDGKYVE